LPGTLDTAIIREATLTRQAVAAQITPVVAKRDTQVTNLRTDLFTRVDKIESDANQQLTDTRAALVKEVQDTRAPPLALIPPAQTVLTNAGALTEDAEDYRPIGHGITIPRRGNAVFDEFT
jgi:hypothetical protein